jgi:hypothetical protein
MVVYLHSEGSTLAVPDDHLMVGMDETGHELLADREYPVFGLGGCAVPAALYPDRIALPWREMKRRHFGSSDTPLHAAELREPTPEQLQALGDFFRQNEFGRYAIVVTDKTVIQPEVPPLDIVAAGVIQKVARYIESYSCEGAVLVAESSERADTLTAAAFRDFRIQITTPEKKTFEVPVEKRRMDKAAAEPLVEVSDFIVHTAGGQVRAHTQGKPFGSRKDFQAVFESVPEPLRHFIHIERADIQRP